MRPHNLVVRCIAHAEGGVWVAVCLDFSLAVQASSLFEVKRALHEQIAIYVREAATIDAEHAQELLCRRAPISDRIEFELRYALARFKKAVKALAYMEPLPLVPAC